MQRLSLFLILIISITILLFSGCTQKKLSYEASCNQRYEVLHAKFQKRNYSSIREALSTFLTECSGSQFVESAQYELAESQYKLQDWTLAKLEFEYLLRNFPATQYKEEASFKIAQCLQKQVYSVNRDQTNTYLAIQEYQNFLLDYGYSTWSDSARKQIKILRTQLAQKEIGIASLYKKRNEYLASTIYLKSALRNYKDVIDTNQVRLELVSCYANLYQFDEAKTYLNEIHLQKGAPLYALLQDTKVELKEKEEDFIKKKEQSKKVLIDEY